MTRLWTAAEELAERALRTAAFIEISGPFYTDISVKIIGFPKGGVILKLPDEPTVLKYGWHYFSMGSEAILRASSRGDEVLVKIRIDDAFDESRYL